MDGLIGIIAPFNCIACGQEGKLVCAKCLKNISVFKRSSCFLCNKLTSGWRACKTCAPGIRLRGVMVASHYEGNIKTLIGLLKYERTVAAAAVLAKQLLPLLEATDKIDAITAVPASARRFRQRGYNQAQLIARQLARQVRLPYVETLGRIGHARQVGTTRRLRLTQAQGTMYARRAYRIRGQRLLVVDDVVTTGATMKEAGRVLKAAGAKYIWGIAAAKH